jgi:phosphotriesterase-related protein
MSLTPTPPARTDRASLRGKVQTVLGPIEPGDLGATLMHEHVLCDITPPAVARQNDPGPEITLENVWAINYGEIKSARKYRLDLLDVAISEVDYLRASGGNAIVELTCGGLKPDPRGLAEISLGTDVHVVMGCGYYVEEYQDPRNFDRTPEDFAEEMIGQVFEGAWGTGIRAGIIGEIGCQTPWTELEKRVMRGAVMAQQTTGAAVNVHPGRHPDQPQEAVSFIQAEGGDLSRVIVSHIDRTIFDTERMLRLADAGAVVEFDLFGIEQSYYAHSDIDMPNDALRLQHIRSLIDRGHLDRVVISHDICYRTRLTRFGGHGYGHIFRNVVPMMRRRGFSQAEIDGILIDNPRGLLTIV